MYSEASVAVVVVCVVLPVLATIAVALRFKARRMKETPFGADDWVILAALITQWASMAMTVYWAVDGGLGDSMENLARHPHELWLFERMLFVGPILFAITITLIKISILLFYKRIFTLRTFRRIVYVVMAFVVAWFIVSVVGTVASSVPFRLYLAPFVKRFNYSAFLLATAALNMTLDLTILILPLFVIRTLKMSFQRKVALLGIFWLGGFCIIASIMRLYYFVLLTRGQNTTTLDTIWSFVEPCCSIIAACLPTLAPLYSERKSLWSLMASAKSSFSGKSSQRSGSSSSSSRENTKMRERDDWQVSSLTYHKAVADCSTVTQQHEIRKNSIRVDRGYSVQSVAEP